jgi:hypothetical protein
MPGGPKNDVSVFFFLDVLKECQVALSNPNIQNAKNRIIDKEKEFCET